MCFKDITKKVKSKCIEWEKICANTVSNKVLLLRIYKEFNSSVIKIYSIKKMGKGFG